MRQRFYTQFYPSSTDDDIDETIATSPDSAKDDPLQLIYGDIKRSGAFGEICLTGKLLFFIIRRFDIRGARKHTHTTPSSCLCIFVRRLCIGSRFHL